MKIKEESPFDNSGERDAGIFSIIFYAAIIILSIISYHYAH